MISSWCLDLREDFNLLLPWYVSNATEKVKCRHWSACSVVRSTAYSFKGHPPVWFPALPWWLTNTCNSSSRGSNTLFQPPRAPVIHMVHRYTCKQNTHTHKFKNVNVKLMLNWTCRGKELRFQDNSYSWIMWNLLQKLSTLTSTVETQHSEAL